MTARTQTIWTFVITSIALFMVSLDNLVVSTAIPVIRLDLHASLESLSWTVNAYTLTFAVLLLTGAALGDRFGRRRMFAIGVGIFTLASVAAALAPNVEVLNIARAVQGLGGAIVMPLTLTILSAAVPAGEARPRARRLGRDRRPRDRVRAGRRRRRRRGLLLAVHLLAQRPDRDPARAARTDPAHREPRPGGQARPARRRPRQRRHVRDRLGPDPRQRPGLDEPRDPRGPRARHRPRRRVRRLGAPCSRTRCCR